MGRVAQTPLAAIGLLTPAPRSTAAIADRLLVTGHASWPSEHGYLACGGSGRFGLL